MAFFFYSKMPLSGRNDNGICTSYVNIRQTVIVYDTIS